MKELKNPAVDVLAEEISGQFEGDIVISQVQMDELTEMRRIGQRSTKYRWKDNTVDFKKNSFSSTIKLSIISAKDQKNFIRQAMDKLEEVSCVKFVPFHRDRHDDYIKVSGEREGCFSQIGRQGSLLKFHA